MGVRQRFLHFKAAIWERGCCQHSGPSGCSDPGGFRPERLRPIVACTSPAGPGFRGQHRDCFNPEDPFQTCRVRFSRAGQRGPERNARDSRDLRREGVARHGRARILPFWGSVSAT